MTKDGPMLSGLTLGFVTSFASPVVIVGETGEIVWYNKAFLAMAGERTTLYGKKLSEHFSPSLGAARLFRDAGEPIQVSWRGVNYNVSCYKTQSVGKGHCIAVWEDTTELCTLKKELEMKSVMVAFVVIDNFSEAVQFIQDKQRTALALIGSTLDAWTASLGGILKEYDKDKFIIIFEQRHFEKLDESRFDILDKIREIEIDNINMPFTASIGVSKISGTLAEKESAARSALRPCASARRRPGSRQERKQCGILRWPLQIGAEKDQSPFARDCRRACQSHQAQRQRHRDGTQICRP